MTENDMYLNLLSGAVVAIVTLIATGYVSHRKKIYERRLRHYNSLVTLQRQLMDIDSALHDNRIMINQIFEGAKQKRIMIALPKQLVLSDNYFNDFYVLELNQRLYAFRYNMQRINFDFSNFGRMYDTLGNAFATGQIDSGHYSLQIAGLFVERKDLNAGIDALQEQCTVLLGYVKARIKKDKSPLIRWRSLVIQHGVWPFTNIKLVSNEEVQNEIKNYLDGIKQNQVE